MKKQYICIAVIVLLTALMVSVSAHSTVTFELRAGGSAPDKEIYVKPVNAETVWTIVPILPYGQSAPVELAPDVYRVGVTDGNGGQPESQIFPLIANEHKVVVLLGHAVASGHKEEKKPVEIKEICFTIQKWIPGYYTYEKVWECGDYSRQSCWCKWVWKCIWHPGHWESRTQCEK